MNVFAKPAKQAILGLAAMLLSLMASQSSAGGASAEVPADWVRVSADSVFSLFAPAGTAYQPGEGIDSIIGTFDAADFQLQSDYGAYSDSLITLSEVDQYQAWDVEVDGKSAKIVTAYAPLYSTERPYFIGIHFPELGETVIGKTRLTIYALLASPDDYALIEKIYVTIQFN